MNIFISYIHITIQIGPRTQNQHPNKHPPQRTPTPTKTPDHRSQRSRHPKSPLQNPHTPNTPKSTPAQYPKSPLQHEPKPQRPYGPAPTQTTKYHNAHTRRYHIIKNARTYIRMRAQNQKR